jgi:hypothetical protein
VKSGLSQEFLMDSAVAELYRQFDAYLNTNRGRIRRDFAQFKRTAAQSHLLYGGRPLAVGFYPVVLSDAQCRYVRDVVEALLRLMEKTTELFLREPSVRPLFGFTPEQIDLIETDPCYGTAIPCSRFDAFLYGPAVWFTELNTDGTAGMDGAEKVSKLFLTSPTMQEFFEKFPVRTFDINRRVLQTLLDCHERFAGGRQSKRPRIAIVDWKEARTCEEFIAFAEFCRAQGYEAVVADPRELEYEGGVLSHQGAALDILYRRVVSSEYVERLDEVEAMTRAFKDRAVCVVGSFRSDIAFNKKCFALLHSPEFARFLTSDERRLVNEHVPWTHMFEDADCNYRGRTINMPEMARQNKDAFVLKPANLYEGRGVWLGARCTPEEWEEKIDAALEQDYVMQEFMPMPSMQIGTWKRRLEMKTRFIHLGAYVFGGRFAGFYCRAAAGPLIDRRSRERIVPCLILGK